MHHVHAELLQLCYDRKALAAEEEAATCSRARGLSEYVQALRTNNFAQSELGATFYQKLKATMR
jgi:hypothetical protein